MLSKIETSSPFIARVIKHTHINKSQNNSIVTTNIPQPEKIVLDNGLKIITQQIPHALSCALNIAVNVGSVNEDESINGISHFIEHMVFKGTKTRSALDISEQSENVGVDLNAFTDNEITSYEAQALSENLPIIIELFLDMLFNPKIDKKDLELEMKVILEEIKMYEDSPQSLVQENACKTIWNGHPLGRPILGTIKSVSKLSRDPMIDYINNFYKPDNMTVSIAGASFDIDKVVKQIRNFTSSVTSPSKKNDIPPLSFTSGTSIKDKNMGQAHLVLLTKGLSITDEDKYILRVINSALGDGRLFQEIREKRGLVYSVNSFYDMKSLGGIFGVYTGMSSKNLKLALKLILKELESIKKDGLRNEEIERAKNKSRTELLIDLESIAKRSWQNAYQDLYFNRFIMPDEINQKIRSVTNEQIVELANKLFDPQHFVLAVVGPQKELPKKIMF